MLLFLALAGNLAGCGAQSATVDPSIATSRPAATAPRESKVANDLTVTVDQPCSLQFSTCMPSSGIDFVHVSGDGPHKPFPAANGSGVGAVDYDLDGNCDLYFATGNSIPVAPGGGANWNRLYRNCGDCRFQDRTAAAGVDHNGFSAGICTGDFNSDGFPDVYVVCLGSNILYENRGDGTFADISDVAGLDDPRWGTSAVFFDMDADGLLDLYVGNYGRWSPESNPFCGDRQKGLRMFCSPNSIPPESDAIYRNRGDGRFVEVGSSVGLPSRPGRTQGVLAADLDGDAFTDLYVANDLNPNGLLINDRGQSFTDQGEILGGAYDRSGVAQAGMGLSLADADRDGRFDLIVTNFENEHNAFYQRDAAGFFHDTSHQRGLAAAGLPHIGWGVALADFDADGWHDAIVLNGHTDNNLHELGREGDYEQLPLLLRNRSGRFDIVGACAGDYFRTPHAGRGLAIADLDNDLDWDVVCCHQDTRPDLLRNDTPVTSKPQFVFQLQLIGRAANRDAIGAVVMTESADGLIVEQVIGGGSYLSSSQPLIQYAGARPVRPQAIQIVWPGGHRSHVAGIESPGQRYVVVEPVAAHSTAIAVPQVRSLSRQSAESDSGAQ